MSAVQAQPVVVVPIQHMVDTRAKFSSTQLPQFWSHIWTEAMRDLQRGGIQVKSISAHGEIRRSPSGAPIFAGLTRNVVNMVITDRVPTLWDNGRGLSGLTTQYDGFHLCLISLDHAHGHRIAFVSVNTCLHELLHVLMLDVFERRPSGVAGEMREMRVDALATRLWLFGDGVAVRKSAERYVQRLKSA